MHQEFYRCKTKSSLTKYIYDKWNHIRSIIVPFSIYYIRNPSLYVSIHKLLPEFLQLELFLTSTVLIVTILFNVNLFLTVLDFSNESQTTYHISYNSWFSYYLVLFVPIYCFNYFLESATPQFYQVFFISELYKTLLSLHSLHQQLF